MGRVAILLGVPVVIAVLVAIPLGLLKGSIHWWCAGVALVLTVLPGLLTLILAERLAKSSPLGSMVALVVGTAVRVVVGFGGAAAVFFGAGDTFRGDPIVFWGWVLGSYLVTLAVETALLGRRMIAVDKGLAGSDRPARQTA